MGDSWCCSVSCFLVWSCLTLSGSFLVTDAVTVETPLGKVRGTTSPNSENFLGIKYAHAARFEYPVAVQPWPEVYDATRVGPACYQLCPEYPKFLCQSQMSEDCLTLNIFRPKNVRQTSLPVMVFIHGGQFEYYSSGSLFYFGDFFVAEARVILVTLNYRLGPLGWLGFVGDHGEVKAANFGLADQREAMAWVKDYIGYFGGNPGQITLFGQSSGAQSVGLHLINPSSRPLFHQAILQSSPFLVPFRTAAEARMQTADLSTALNCTEGDIICLRSKSPMEIVSLAKKSPVPSSNLLMSFEKWGPTVDGFNVTDQCLLTSLIRAKASIDLPVIIGTVQDEGVSFLHGLLHPPLPEFQYRMMVNLWVPNLAGRILQFYPGSPEDSFPDLARLAKDLMFFCPARSLATALPNSGSSVWQYVFSQPLKLDVWPEKHPCGSDTTCHGLELPFLFNGPELAGFNLTAVDHLLSSIMIDYWGKFAWTGNPNGDVVGMTSWPAVNSPLGTARKEGVAYFRFEERNLGSSFWVYSEMCQAFEENITNAM